MTKLAQDVWVTDDMEFTIDAKRFVEFFKERSAPNWMRDDDADRFEKEMKRIRELIDFYLEEYESTKDESLLMDGLKECVLVDVSNLNLGKSMVGFGLVLRELTQCLSGMVEFETQLPHGQESLRVTFTDTDVYIARGRVMFEDGVPIEELTSIPKLPDGVRLVRSI